MKEMINEMLMECILGAECVGSEMALYQNCEMDEIAVKRSRSRLRGMKKMLKIACKHANVDYDELEAEIKEARDKSYSKEIERLSNK